MDNKRLLERSNRNWNFFEGDQWAGLEADGMEMPVINFIHPNVMRKVTTIYQNRMSVNYTDMEGREDMQPVYEKLTQMFAWKWEKANEDVLCRKSLKDGCITGDGLQFFPTRDVEDVQILNNTDVLYGDESETSIQRQPYIIIQERKSVEDVRKMARENGIPEDEVALIIPDKDTEYTLGNTDEVQNSDTNDTMKVTMITHLEKKKEPITEMVWEDTEEGRKGTLVEVGERDVVYIARCTKNAMVEEEHPIKGEPSEIQAAMGKQGRGLTMYPLIKFSWETFPNDARGVSQVEYLIPNQLMVNKTYARWSMTITNCAYPRMAYSSTYVKNPEDLMKVGMPIEVEGGDAMSVNQAVSYLSAASTNGEPKQMVDAILEVTQELSGSGDTTMGNIDLQRVAASAIVAVNDQAQSMHDETVANLKMFVEDMANVWVDIWQAYNPNGMPVIMKRTEEVPVIDPMTGKPKIDPMTGQPQMESKEVEYPDIITAEELDMLKPRTRIDVTKDTAFISEARQQENDKLLEMQQINFEEWVEASEAGTIPKGAYERILERRKQQMQEQQQAAMQQQMAQQMPQPEQ